MPKLSHALLDVVWQVIIAGAGGAAHLPGMVAALTPLPVIGVPVTPPGCHLDGLDALLSIVQMPRGVPVATVAIGNAGNAGLLAARILATSDSEQLLRVLRFQVRCYDRDITNRKSASGLIPLLPVPGYEDAMQILASCVPPPTACEMDV